MEAYLELVRKVMQKGVKTPNRTGMDAIVIFGEKFEHDMADGFSLLTTKKIKFENVGSELEFFIKGLTDKRWLQERGNPIWDAWCNREKVPYQHDEETRHRMKKEPDLGPVYGFQWRHFGADYLSLGVDYTGKGKDELARIVRALKTDPHSREMVVNAWNANQLHQMALPPCHYSFQINVLDGKIDLLWNQRSVDVMVGLPFNLASYGLLLHLLAMETGYGAGKIVGSLGNTHIYVDHLKGAEKQLSRKPLPLPTIETTNFSSIFDWKYTDTEVLNYQHHPFIKYPIAV